MFVITIYNHSKTRIFVAFYILEYVNGLWAEYVASIKECVGIFAGTLKYIIP